MTKAYCIRMKNVLMQLWYFPTDHMVNGFLNWHNLNQHFLFCKVAAVLMKQFDFLYKIRFHEKLHLVKVELSIFWGNLCVLTRLVFLPKSYSHVTVFMALDLLWAICKWASRFFNEPPFFDWFSKVSFNRKAWV